MARLCYSLFCFDVGCLVCLLCSSQLVLGFLSEEIVMYVVDLMCLWEKVCSGSCVTHLEPEPSRFNFIDAKRGHMVCGHRILSPWGITGSNIISMHIGRILRWLPIFLPPGVHTPSLSYPTRFRCCFGGILIRLKKKSGDFKKQGYSLGLDLIR